MHLATSSVLVTRSDADALVTSSNALYSHLLSAWQMIIPTQHRAL